LSATTSTTTTTTATTTSKLDAIEIEIEVEDGVVSPPAGRVSIPLDSTVHLRVASDVVDEVHVHGYDLFDEIGPGQTVELEFVAEVAGIFEVELEEAGLLLVELEVAP
jgi:heme/copper-type cytochrome/quinol oxidase subunit 2